MTFFQTDSQKTKKLKKINNKNLPPKNKQKTTLVLFQGISFDLLHLIRILI